MKVAKFGGSSLASAQQIQKVAKIIQDDPEIKIVVVSAPGKRDEADIKVTDLLIALHADHQSKKDTTPALEKVVDRYQSIIQELGMNEHLVDQFRQTLQKHLDTIENSYRLLDALKSCGEDFNAQVISQYLNKIGVESAYLSPKDAGIRLTDKPGDAQLIKSSYKDIAKYKDTDKVLVVPGFYGYSPNGEIVTFSRGGSDISGAIMAHGVDAERYENFTDESYIYSAHPGKIRKPHAIKTITYEEMRELAYSGFTIFHDEALQPLYEKEIPIQVRNTNAPEIEGTLIVSRREDTEEYPVIGISADDGFLTITIRKYLLNKAVGTARRFLQIFEDHGLRIEHMPSGIDTMSVILRSNQFVDRQEQMNELIDAIQTTLDPEWIQIEENLSIIMVVGAGMNQHGMAYKATKAFTESNCNIRMINQGASEISMMFAVESKDEDKALKALYDNYFRQ